ncbi:hypothetical protein EDB87DRAFT_1824211 [Lactarius vividus]|nr:hypothetical protein EDB87DRAFT_1824211 [Lactarius vividus]
MSQVPSTATSSTDFATIFTTALEAYKQQTKKDITSHPLAAELQSCDTSSAILAVLQAQVQAFDQSQSVKLTRWLDPTVNVLYAFSATLSSSVGLIFPPSNAIFAGIGVLLQAVKDVHASQNALIDLFGRLEHFFKRLEKYIKVRPTATLLDIIVKIMVEVLSILGIMTKEIGQGKIKKYLKKLAGRKDIEDALQRLDRLTQEEAWMATAENLEITRSIDDKMKDVDEKVEGVNEGVRGVDMKVEGIDSKMQSFGSQVQGVDRKVGSVIEDLKENGVAIQQVANQVSNMNRKKLRKDLRKWVALPDPSFDDSFYIIASSMRHKGTAVWCTKGNTLTDWKTSGPLLWIHGKPGSGKTVLRYVTPHESRFLIEIILWQVRRLSKI